MVAKIATQLEMKAHGPAGHALLKPRRFCWSVAGIGSTRSEPSSTTRLIVNSHARVTRCQPNCKRSERTWQSATMWRCAKNIWADNAWWCQFTKISSLGTPTSHSRNDERGPEIWTLDTAKLKFSNNMMSNRVDVGMKLSLSIIVQASKVKHHEQSTTIPWEHLQNSLSSPLFHYIFYFIKKILSPLGGTPKSSKSFDHFSIETYGDLGILHF